jgi:hypothetical protein
VSALSKLSIALVSLVALLANAQSAGWSDFEQKDLTKPDRVVERLRRGATPTEQQFEKDVAKYIARESEKKRQGKGRGAILKSYFELALSAPTPRHLTLLADEILEDSFVRRKVEHRPKKVDEWIQQHADLYASAIAANEVIPQLDTKQLNKVRQEKTCAEQYLATKVALKDCRPVAIVLGTKK